MPTTIYEIVWGSLDLQQGNSIYNETRTAGSTCTRRQGPRVKVPCKVVITDCTAPCAKWPCGEAVTAGGVLSGLTRSSKAVTGARRTNNPVSVTWVSQTIFDSEEQKYKILCSREIQRLSTAALTRHITVSLLYNFVKPLKDNSKYCKFFCWFEWNQHQSYKEYHRKLHTPSPRSGFECYAVYNCVPWLCPRLLRIPVFLVSSAVVRQTAALPPADSDSSAY